MAIEGIKGAASSAAISASVNMAKQNTTVTETKEVGVQNNNRQPDTVKVQTANKGSQQSKDSANTAADDNSKKVEQDIQLNEKALKQRISEINSKLNNNTVAEFGYHDETNRVTIKIVDKDTKETIKEIPPEKTLDLIVKAWELAGILVDEKR